LPILPQSTPAPKLGNDKIAEKKLENLCDLVGSAVNALEKAILENVIL